MTNMYKLPPDAAADVDAFEQDVKRFLAGDLAPALFKARRVPRGIYEQRRNGTFMVRIRLAGGVITPEAMRIMAGLAAQYGNGMLHVTTRQDVQLHDIRIADAPAVLRRLLAAGLSTRGGGGNTVRNVTACPLAGICAAEAFDVVPAARAVTEYLIAQPGSYNLPRKFKVAFSGCRADCAMARVTDAGFIASVRDGKPGYEVYAGGGMGASSRLADRLIEWQPCADAVRTTEVLRRLFDRLGDRRNKHRARLRYVFEQRGPKGLRPLFDAELAGVTSGAVPDGAVPAVPGGAAPAVAEPGANGETLWTRRGRFLVMTQKQSGFVAVSVPLPLGFVTAPAFTALAGLAARFGSRGEVRATQTQGLVIPFVPEQEADALLSGLACVAGLSEGASSLDKFTACAGASTCRLGLCLARGAAAACAEALDAAGLSGDVLRGLRVNISGCPNSCGQHPVAAVGFSGSTRRSGSHLAPAYRVTMGGRTGGESARLGDEFGTIPARALPEFLVGVVHAWKAARREGESFNEWLDRAGVAPARALVERFSSLPDAEADPDYYRDWGVDEPFSLAGRGAGECGAGVFEVIAADIAEARRLLGGRESGPVGTTECRDGVLAATRALLVVHGVDSRDSDVILREFENRFIETRLVDAGFRDLVVRTRALAGGWKDALNDMAPLARALVDRVDVLFGTLDAELKFHPPEAAAVEPGAPQAQAASASAVTTTKELDLSGVACPMNFVKARIVLEDMQVGERLAVRLDDGEPIQNVPASFRNEGQKIEDVSRVEGGGWRVVILKNN